MEPDDINSPEDKANLRYGWTTGACATAAAKAAYIALMTGEFPDPVEIVLPKGHRPAFALAEEFVDHTHAYVGIVKDAGDDPDVTHGALIRSDVRLTSPGNGITFKAGHGVGMITREGLPLAVGEPAINPGPRSMIRENMNEAIKACGGSPDMEITISVDNGKLLAKRTWNARLGIIGGLSILGTTGIVVPYSCSAWIASIHSGVDVARAAGLKHLAASTGSTSENAVAKMYGLPLIALLDMGDFVGGTLKYLRKHPFAKLTLAGGFGKMSKLAAGHMDLHSKRSQVDTDFIANLAEGAGANSQLVTSISACKTAGEILVHVSKAKFPLGNVIAQKAQAHALKIARNSIDIEVVIFDRQGELVGRAGFTNP